MSTTSISIHVRKDDEPPKARLLSTKDGAYVDFGDGALTIFARDPQQLQEIGDAFHTAARLLTRLTRQLAADARDAAEATSCSRCRRLLHDDDPSNTGLGHHVDCTSEGALAGQPA